jgi:hypothetical protein
MEAHKPCSIARPAAGRRSGDPRDAEGERPLYLRLEPDHDGRRAVRIAGDPFVEDSQSPREFLTTLLDSAGSLEEKIEKWVTAGVDVLLAPTLSATPAALRPLGLAHRSAEINQVAVETLRRVSSPSSRPLWVAAQVGPLGGRWQGGAFHGFDEAYVHYHEQAKSLALAGPDLVVIRGITGIRLLRAAVVAIRELWSGPILVLLDAPRPPVPAATLEILSSLGVQGVGLEGFPQAESIDAVARARGEHGFTLLASVLPCGLNPGDGLSALAHAGLDLAFLGGPEGLRALRVLRERTPSADPKVPRGECREAFRPPSRSLRRGEDLLVALELDPLAQGIRAESGLPFVRASHTGICLLSETETLVREGLRRRNLEEWVSDVEVGQGRPLALVAKDPLLLETSLKGAAGRSIAYLDSADTSIWQSTLFLASRYGAKLAFRLKPPGRENGGTHGSCLPLIHRLLAEADEYGLAAGDLYVDPIGIDETGAPAWDSKALDATLRQMAIARGDTGVRWILACHHFREVGGSTPGPDLQVEILSRALLSGLDAVFLSPDQEHLVRVLSSHRAR